MSDIEAIESITDNILILIESTDDSEILNRLAQLLIEVRKLKTEIDDETQNFKKRGQHGN